jgi:hypothetical protein
MMSTLQALPRMSGLGYLLDLGRPTLVRAMTALFHHVPLVMVVLVHFRRASGL